MLILYFWDTIDQNAIQISNRPSVKRNITIDLLLVTANFFEFHNGKPAEIRNEEIAALQKLVYFYDKNPGKIDKILTQVDQQYLMLAKDEDQTNTQNQKTNFENKKQRIEKTTDPTSRAARLTELNEEWQEEIETLAAENKKNLDSLPSKRFNSLISEIRQKAAELGTKPYEPKLDGEYASRKVETVLTPETTEQILNALQGQVGLEALLPKNSSQQLNLYNAGETFKLSKDLNLTNTPSKNPILKSLINFMERCGCILGGRG